MNKFAVVEKQFQYKGHDCICVFTRHGYRNGYVSVNDDRDYNEYDIDCHGGLTWSGKLPYDYGQKKTYYIGFDCGHLGDYHDYDTAHKYNLISEEEVEYLKETVIFKDGIAWPLEYVEEQCKKIVDQLEAEKK